MPLLECKYLKLRFDKNECIVISSNIYTMEDRGGLSSHVRDRVVLRKTLPFALPRTTQPFTCAMTAQPFAWDRTTQPFTCRDNITFKCNSRIFIQTFYPFIEGDLTKGLRGLGYCLEITISEIVRNDNNCYGGFG